MQSIAGNSACATIALVLLQFACSTNACGQTVAGAMAEVSFASDIRPLLSDRCFACHGPDEEHREADLRVDDLESLTEDRGGYKVVDLARLDESEILARIASDDPDEMMPPPDFHKPLSPEEQSKLRGWVLQGAKWQQHWAYVKPEAGPLPAVKTYGPAQNNWIDLLVDLDLASGGITRSQPADTITVARRLSFDLTGLAPSATDLAAMTSGRSGEVSRYIDRLLASPAFAERLAVYWLDLVRYADTVGYHGDQDQNISPYRDYIIRSFAQNKPFDQLTVEQLAGDLLPQPTDDQIVATGYNRLLQTSHEGGVQPAEYRAIYAADRVRNVSAVWLGATVGCAQCHDHKYDPITAKDFYALSAFFADVDDEQHFKVGSNALPTRRPPERIFYSPQAAKQLAELQLAKQALVAEVSDEAATLAESCDDSGRAAEEQQSRLVEIEARMAALEKSGRLSMVTKSITPRVTRVLPRGNWLDDSGEVVLPAVPSAFGSLNLEKETGAVSRATRLDLARWLVDAEDGAGLLTARVMVNRLWALMFGQGLSRSVEDFGGQGESPTHPRLLDELALRFVASGWDIKYIMREIALSATYRQASLSSAWHDEHDPDNRLLSRQNRFRVAAEMVRDHALACGGLLVTQTGGASVKPYQPPGYYRHLNFPTRRYSHDTGASQWRRGVYVHWQRQFLHPMLRAFDAPTREECSASRAQSNTPLASIVLLNDPTFVEAARGLAMRVTTTSDQSDAGRINAMFEIATSRQPQVAEIDALREVLHSARRSYEANTQAAEEFSRVGQLRPMIDENVSIQELSAWTTVARVILNMGQTYARN